MAQPTPFKIAVPDVQLQWINDRVATARIPPGKELPTPTLWKSWGLPSAYAHQLQQHWTTKYDWRAVEAQLNAELRMFTLPIPHVHEGESEDVEMHFVHHRSSRDGAIPLLFLHGWPGSFLEVRPLIAHLTSPASQDDQAFHVVAPSLPGFGFSSYPSKPCGPVDMADMAHALMQRLGYPQFVVQGGDWGSMIGRLIAVRHPSSCRAIHVNMVLAALPSALRHPLSLVRALLAFATGGRIGVTEFDWKMLSRMNWWRSLENGFSVIQGTKPQTVSYALVDSPLGMCCWLRDKVQFLVDDDFEWTDEEVITWAMPYILNGTPGHAEIYKWASSGEDKSLLQDLFAKIIPSSVPFGASIFPKDAAYAPRWWAECKIAQNIVFWKEHTLGGHFPAVERPAVLAADIREFIGKVDLKVLDEVRNSYK